MSDCPRSRERQPDGKIVRIEDLQRITVEHRMIGVGQRAVEDQNGPNKTVPTTRTIAWPVPKHHIAWSGLIATGCCLR